MNRLRYADESISDIENGTVKKVSRYNQADNNLTQGVAIKMEDGITHYISHQRSCCEIIKVYLPENIQHIHNRKILTVSVTEGENDQEDFDHLPLADVEITDSLGEKYIIVFTGKSVGCMFSPHIEAHREWVSCVFD